MEDRGPLIIEDVDLAMLDSPRLLLGQVIAAALDGEKASAETLEGADGILGMLDHWSDSRAAKKAKERCL